jgi:bacterial microcompartment shell protein
MNKDSAIAILELNSAAAGTTVADAMVKRAPIGSLRMGTIQPGKYLVLVTGSVAVVEEAYDEGLRIGGACLCDHIFLPHVHEQVSDAVEGVRRVNRGDALGIIETATIPAIVGVSDRAIKNADVSIIEIRLGDGLGGKGLVYLDGKVEDVEAAIEAGVFPVLADCATHSSIIPMQHVDIRERVERTSSFSQGPMV